jgi:branched-chain amino acid transport system permease protein
VTLDFTIQLVLNGFVLASVYVVVAMGLALIYSIMHLINFAHGEFYMLGSYVVYSIFVKLGYHYIVATICAIILMGVIGLFVERFLLRPFAGVLLPAVLVGMGLMFVLQTIAVLVFGPEPVTIANPYPGSVRIFGAAITIERLIVIGVAIAAILAIFLFLRYTATGQAMRAISQDREMCTLVGINAGFISNLCMGISCGLAGLAGATVGHIFFVDPWMGQALLFKGFACIILAGLGSIPGVLISSALLGLIESFVATLVDPVLANMVAFIVIIAVLIIRPQGLMGLPTHRITS